MRLPTKLLLWVVAGPLVAGAMLIQLGLDIFRLDREVSHLADTQNPLAKAADELEINVVEAGLAALKYVAQPSPAHRERFLDQHADVLKHLEEFESLATRDDLITLGVRFKSTYTQYHQLALRLIDTRDRTDELRHLVAEEVASVLKTLDNQPGGDAQTTVRRHLVQFLVMIALPSDHPTRSSDPTPIPDIVTLGRSVQQRSVLPVAGQISERLGALVALSAELRESEADSGRLSDEFVDIRRRLDDLLDDEMQVATRSALIQVVESSRATARDVWHQGLAALAITALAGLLGVLHVSRSVALPLRRLHESVRAAAAGRWTPLPPVPSLGANDELGAVLREFNSMCTQVAHAHEELRVLNKDLQQQVEARTAALSDTVRQLQAANAARATFLANMSHELRTPLNAIIGFSELLRSGAAATDSDKHREYLDDILHSATHLLAIINQILDLARIDAGQVLVDETPFDAEGVIEECLRMVSRAALERNISIENTVESAPSLMGDVRLVRQCLLNLLTNAIKYNRRGGRLRVAVDRRPAELAIVIADTGIGMRSNELARMTEPFVRGGNVYVRSEDGVGLGLALVKRYIELHGGKLQFESETGKGTVARLIFPADRICEIRQKRAS